MYIYSPMIYISAYMHVFYNVSPNTVFQPEVNVTSIN